MQPKDEALSEISIPVPHYNAMFSDPQKPTIKHRLNYPGNIKDNRFSNNYVNFQWVAFLLSDPCSDFGPQFCQKLTKWVLTNVFLLDATLLTVNYHDFRGCFSCFLG